jgi:hypothetical protein
VDPLICKRCRTEIDTDAVVCFSCGYVLKPDAARLMRAHATQPADPTAPNGSSLTRTVSLLATVLIVLFNSVFWFCISLLAVTGSGGAKGIKQLWLIGFGIIGLLTTFSFVLSRTRIKGLAPALACLQIPIIFLALHVGSRIERTLAQNRPSPPELQDACRNAGAEYLAQPSEPVKSIAYDWPPGSTPPYYTHFRLDARGNLLELRYGIDARTFPAQIEYIEARCCREMGTAASGKMPFIRWVGNSLANQPVPDITADVLVQLSRTDRPVERHKSQLSKIEAVVTDRRDGKILAKLHYALDERNRRACGFTSPGTMDEKEFVMKAIGLSLREN